MRILFKWFFTYYPLQLSLKFIHNSWILGFLQLFLYFLEMPTAGSSTQINTEKEKEERVNGSECYLFFSWKLILIKKTISFLEPTKSISLSIAGKKPYLYPSHPIRFTTTANSKVLSFLYSWSTPIFNPQENIKHQKVKHHPSNIRKYYQGKWDVEAYPSSSNFPHNVSNRGSRTTWAENRNKKNYVKNYYEAFLQMGWHIADNE